MLYIFSLSQILLCGFWWPLVDFVSLGVCRGISRIICCRCNEALCGFSCASNNSAVDLNAAQTQRGVLHYMCWSTVYDNLPVLNLTLSAPEIVYWSTFSLSILPHALFPHCPVWPLCGILLHEKCWTGWAMSSPQPGPSINYDCFIGPTI